jgi:uncharacterized protein (DUF433 family)
MMTRQRSDEVISAFTEDQVERLTGVSVRQLRHWDRTGFFAPAYAEPDRRVAFARVYSFVDVLCLQVLGSLRNDLGCSMPHLREVKKKLCALDEAAWVKTTLYVVKKRVVFDDPQKKKRVDVLNGQGILNIQLETVRSIVADRLALLRQRDQSTFGRISQDRRVNHNVPVIAGTRIPVRAIQAFAAAGYTADAIIEEYPTLTTADVAAALAQEKAA